MIEIIGTPKLSSANEIEQVANDCIGKLGISNTDIIEILFVDQAKIQQLNSAHRKINKPTDVLSFPQYGFKSVKDQILGTIVICEDMAAKLKETNADLVQHGMLHLLGYDHETDAESWNQIKKILGN